MINVYQLTVIETYPQLIGYDPAVYNYFREQYVIPKVYHSVAHCHVRRTHLCGLDLNLTYPQNGTFPTLNPPFPNQNEEMLMVRRNENKSRLFKRALKEDLFERRTGVSKRDAAVEAERLARRDQWKRDLSGRANGTIDPWYKCDLYDEMIDYAVNFSLPWSRSPCPSCRYVRDTEHWSRGSQL